MAHYSETFPPSTWTFVASLAGPSVVPYSSRCGCSVLSLFSWADISLGGYRSSRQFKLPSFSLRSTRHRAILSSEIHSWRVQYIQPCFLRMSSFVLLASCSNHLVPISFLLLEGFMNRPAGEQVPSKSTVLAWLSLGCPF